MLKRQELINKILRLMMRLQIYLGQEKNLKVMNLKPISLGLEPSRHLQAITKTLHIKISHQQ
jgi:hypothetical protein